MTIKKSRLQPLILVLGIALIAAGIKQGDYRDTLMKAIMICLECIGIG